MLSRVAESLMWMSRYLERANSLARIVEAVEEFSLDHHHPELSNEEAFWAPVYDILNLTEEKKDYIKEDAEQEIYRHLLLDKENVNSVYSCISAARFNARGIRDQIMNEIWEAINDLYLYCEELSKKKTLINVSDFGSRVRFTVHCIRGLVESVMEQKQAWCFLMLGMRLERADQMSRLLDLKNFMLAEERKQIGLLEPYVWLIIMKVSGSKAGIFGNSQADWNKLGEHLIFNLVNPNSIRYSVRKVNEVLHFLSSTRRGVFSNSAEKACGKLQGGLDYASFIGLGEKELHSYLDQVQVELAEVFSQILETYTHSGQKASLTTSVQSQ